MEINYEEDTQAASAAQVRTRLHGSSAAEADEDQRPPKVLRTLEPMEILAEKMMQFQQQQSQMMLQMMEDFAQALAQQQVAQRAPAPTSAPEAPSAPPSNEGFSKAEEEKKTKELKEKMVAKDKAELERLFGKEKGKFGKKVSSYLKSIDMLKTREKEADVMMHDRTCEVYPEPMRGFKAYPSEAELDTVFSKCNETDFEYKVTIPKGTSRRRTMEILHHQMTAMHKVVLVESAKEKVATLKTASRAETFKANILQAQETYYSERSTTGVDLDRPQRSRPSKE